MGKYHLRVNYTKIGLLVSFVLVLLLVYQLRKPVDRTVKEKDNTGTGRSVNGKKSDSSLVSDVKEETPNSPGSDKERILAAAREITKNGDTLLVSFITKSYLPFAYSWLCNVKDMKITHNILIIAADNETALDLWKRRPDIKTVFIRGYKMKGDQSYTRAGYVRIGIKRTQILNWILQDNHGIFLFEFDCLWLRNPIPILTKYTEHDLVITPVAERPGMVAIGFYYMAPTDRMKKLWQELTRRLTVLDEKLQKMSPGTVISEGENDQVYLTTLIRQKYADVRLKLLSLNEYPDGKWYSLPQSKRQNMEHIIIINNNWVVGNKAKITRAKKFGHWFLNDDGSCDEDQVNRVVQMY